MKPKAPTRRTLGPVSDLERHLPAEWWRTLFNAVYLRTDGDVVENDTNTQADVDLVIDAIGLEVNDRILDLCCGQGRHSLELARRGFRRITGLDRSRYLIRLARKRAKERGFDVRFREGDARKFAFRGNDFDCVLVMGNSFGYFDQEDDDLAVLSTVSRALRPSGKLFMDVTNGDWMRENFEPRSWEWIDENHFVCRERSLSADGDRLVSREVVVHAEKGVIADQFYAERLYTRDRLHQLLGEAGLYDIRFHDEVETLSSRGTDLGMMARRNIVSARTSASKKAAKGARGALYPDVTVIFGDPRLPDTIKRGCAFNPEDIETIDRFKEAVGELEEYRFTYIDNHAALLKTLREEPPAFALNLCDEGYNNEATMELHVPAVLEMLSIPYSGAGPQALGLCYNKSLVRAVAATCEVPVPLETYFDADDQSATIPSIFPALIKPCMGDSSIGITQDAVIQDPAEAIAYLGKLRHAFPGRPVLVQEFLSGAEYSVGLIGNPGVDFIALPVLEVDYSNLDPSLPQILGYESKWLPDSPYWNDIRYLEANIPDDLQRLLVDWSMTLFQRLGCRDYARFDFRADAAGDVKLLEVNPNPGWCWDGKLNLMAGFAGYRYPDLVRMVIEAAQRRSIIEEHKPLNTEQNPTHAMV
ncbi:MAG: methyltransferase domain-containing protein [Rhodospirillales bacterium]|nr:methyltransferase domain-containing protein [Alphaproteobacteria bacterium]MBL6947300.1 methyltransferase domain-containing protein [Rhodospirillales bacterium]